MSPAPTLVSYDALHRFGPELGFPKVSLAKLGEVREAGLQSLEILRRAGVKIGFGTDLMGPMHARICDPRRGDGAVRHYPLGDDRQRRAVERASELGVIAPGARADLISVDGDPLADISLLDGQGEHLTHIMKGGVFYKTKN